MIECDLINTALFGLQIDVFLDNTPPEWTIEYILVNDVDTNGFIDNSDTLKFWINVTEDNPASDLANITINVDETVAGAPSFDNVVSDLLTLDGGN